MNLSAPADFVISASPGSISLVFTFRLTAFSHRDSTCVDGVDVEIGVTIY